MRIAIAILFAAFLAGCSTTTACKDSESKNWNKGSLTAGVEPLHWKECPNIENEFAESDIVITGKVLASTNVLESDAFIRGTFYSIGVTEVLKGAPAQTVELYDANDSSRFPMEVGTSCLIFAHDGQFEDIRGRHDVSGHGNSGKLSDSVKALANARSLKVQKSSAINQP